MNGEDLWEGTLAIQGVRPTKLTKSKSQETTFSTAGAVKKAAEKFASTHGYSDVKYAEPTATKVSKTSKTTTKKESVKSCSATPMTS
jgi:hypothetical protein